MAAYLYSVNPKKMIKTLKNAPAFRIPKTLELELEDVKECLKYGSVYRRFTGATGNVKVTVDNVERLHNEEFMTPEQYSQFIIDTNSQGHSQVREPEMKKSEVVKEAAPVKNEEVESNREDEPTNDGKIADIESVQDNKNVDDKASDADEVENVAVDATIEEKTNTEVDIDNVKVQKPQPQFNKKHK